MTVGELLFWLSGYNESKKVEIYDGDYAEWFALEPDMIRIVEDNGEVHRD